MTNFDSLQISEDPKDGPGICQDERVTKHSII